MKKILLCVMLMLIVPAVRAQLYLVPEMGMTAIQRPDANKKHIHTTRFAYNTETWRAGWKAGLGLVWHLGKENFALQSGLYYTQRGYSLDYFMLNPKDECFIVDHMTINQKFLQVPLMARFSGRIAKDVKIFGAVGPYIGFALGEEKISYKGSRLGYTDVEVLDETNQYMGKWLYPYDVFGDYYGYGMTEKYNRNSTLNKIDWGLSVALGVEVNQLVLGLGYELSLGKEYDGANIRANYHTVNLSIGYKFRVW